MAEELHDGTGIGAGLGEPGSEGVTEGVEGDVVIKAGFVADVGEPTGKGILYDGNEMVILLVL